MPLIACCSIGLLIALAPARWLAEGLRLAVSGQTQSYVLTVLLAIVLLLSALVWWRAV